MSLSIDHLVILVNSLEAAVDDYTRLGFRVTPGGEHTDGATHNALIAFQDGSYLELIAFKRPAPEHRWWRHTTIGTGEGLIDFALLPTDITQTITELRGRSLNYTGPFDRRAIATGRAGNSLANRPAARARPAVFVCRCYTALPACAVRPGPRASQRRDGY